MTWIMRVIAPVLLKLGYDVRERHDMLMIRRPTTRAHRPSSSRFAKAHGLRLNLGCGETPLKGYVNLDVQPLAEVEVVTPVTDLSMFPDAAAMEVRLDGVYPHLYNFERTIALAEWLRVLQPGGRLVLNDIPDFERIAEQFIGQPDELPVVAAADLLFGRYTPFDVPPMLRKDLFTKDRVKAELELAGFELDALDNPRREDGAESLYLCATAHKPVEIVKV